ncbi:MAG: VOC family protein [Rhodospirillaceae bacterium]
MAPPPIRGLDHVVLAARDMAAMLAFYEGVLGCPLERKLDGIGLHQLRAGGQLIDLIPADAPAVRAARNMDHFCLRLDTWDEPALRAHLAAHGVAAGPTERRYGAEGDGPSIYIEDPEGNVVELKGPPD